SPDNYHVGSVNIRPRYDCLFAPPNMCWCNAEYNVNGIFAAPDRQHDVDRRSDAFLIEQDNYLYQ
ncbi:MAG: hypothetical protein ACKPKO_00685, partial [Candidatus Fonsibacter sp.]